MTWAPILVGEDARCALRIVREIAEAIVDSAATHGDVAPDLAGTAGIALFLAYAETAGLAQAGSAELVLSDAMIAAASAPLASGLWNGAAGLRWLLVHVADDQGVDLLIQRFDGLVLESLKSPDVAMTLDVYSGLSGMMLAYQDDTSKAAAEIRGFIMARFERVKWLDEHDVPGCAHGLAGVAAALARYVSNEPQAGGAALHLRALASLLRRATYVEEIARTFYDSQISWCRGQAGVALALLAAARALEDRELEGEARDMGIAAFAASGSVRELDAALCHGTAGAAHLCNRIAQVLDDRELRDLARRWLCSTMQLRTPGCGIAGYRSLHGRSRVWRADPTLLTGAAGTALVLLAGATEIEPRWDRILAVDL